MRCGAKTQETHDGNCDALQLEPATYVAPAVFSQIFSTRIPGMCTKKTRNCYFLASGPNCDTAVGFGDRDFLYGTVYGTKILASRHVVHYSYAQNSLRVKILASP